MASELIVKLAAEPLIVNGERCITHDLGDQLHERPSGTFRKTFNRHRERMIEGKHYYTMTLKDFRRLRPGLRLSLGGNPRIEVVLLTKRGYLFVIEKMCDSKSESIRNKINNGEEIEWSDIFAGIVSKPKSRKSFVYFIQSSQNKQIKIGISANPQTRIRGISTGGGFNVTTLAIIRGGRDDEQCIHGKFKHLRCVGEWFLPGNELLKYIDELKKAL